MKEANRFRIAIGELRHSTDSVGRIAATHGIREFFIHFYI